ncbi:MAG: HPr(Ser) kinase/phosphatase [Clostridia bacterium]|nr:HPr(Ser) kinase/phosphatase [Clostridia bacterium]
MSKQYFVSVAKIMQEFSLEEIYLPDKAENIMVGSANINRPGLQLSGFYKFFDSTRIQILGLGEIAYISELDPEERKMKVDKFFSQLPVLVVFTRNNDVLPEFLESAKKYNVPIVRTSAEPSAFMASLISYLNVELAPRITRHGVFVEVYGEGILLLGESGVGKSETAIELVKRGHRLIADDAVEIRRVSSKTLVGSSPDNIRHFMELRGVGIINARRLFGMGSVKLTEKIDMVLNLEDWDPEKAYDRVGIDRETTNILGLDITSMTIPVSPGRNLAVIIEIAAMNNRQKKMGYNAAEELLENLGLQNDIQ